ncbi:MAG: hypothetical protein KDI98_07225 [Hyphomicrobiaceae bacterium]|nr:hypothetical protein [Hyphomicrobiaceae bacterium]
MTRSRIWFGLGTAVLAGHSLSPLPATAAEATARAEPPRTDGPVLVFDAGRSQRAAMKAFSAQGGEGGEGGEGGVDPGLAAEDPVAYGVSLAVIEAHYLAGLAAYEAGETEEGAEMFAHGYSEIYADMEEVYLARGVDGLEGALLDAVAKAGDGAPGEEVSEAAQHVLALLEAAEATAPASDDALRTEAAIIVELIDRTAAQYLSARTGGSEEAFLDGYGFAAAAQRRADQHLAAIGERSPALAESLSAALALGREAFPTPLPVADPALEPGVFLAMATQARFALNALH